jgi:hypothetical protein
VDSLKAQLEKTQNDLVIHIKWISKHRWCSQAGQREHILAGLLIVLWRSFRVLGNFRSKWECLPKVCKGSSLFDFFQELFTVQCVFSKNILIFYNYKVVLHHSNIDLESQLRHQSGPSSSGSCSSSGKRYHSSPSPSSGGVTRVMSDPDEGEALSKAKSTVTKQSAEILSLRNQVSFSHRFLTEIH